MQVRCLFCYQCQATCSTPSHVNQKAHPSYPCLDIASSVCPSPVFRSLDTVHLEMLLHNKFQPLLVCCKNPRFAWSAISYICRPFFQGKFKMSPIYLAKKLDGPLILCTGPGIVSCQFFACMESKWWRDITHDFTAPYHQGHVLTGKILGGPAMVSLYDSCCDCLLFQLSQTTGGTRRSSATYYHM